MTIDIKPAAIRKGSEVLGQGEADLASSCQHITGAQNKGDHFTIPGELFEFLDDGAAEEENPGNLGLGVALENMLPCPAECGALIAHDASQCYQCDWIRPLAA